MPVSRHLHDAVLTADFVPPAQGINEALRLPGISETLMKSHPADQELIPVLDPVTGEVPIVFFAYGSFRHN